MFDSDNPVIALCVEGMQHDGEPAKARALFEQAWELRRDSFDASVAAHYLARHTQGPEESLRWNEVALNNADQLNDRRADELIPSLCLNLGQSYALAGRLDEADALAIRAASSLAAMQPDGYIEFVRGGVERLRERIAAARSSAAH